MPVIQVPTTNQADQNLILLLLELHQASRQYLRYDGIQQQLASKAYKRPTDATHAVTLHLERAIADEEGI